MSTLKKCILHLSSIAHNQVVHHFFIYIFGAICVGGFSFLLAPINMRILTPDEYGILALITSSITIGATLLGLGLRQVLSIEYFHHDAHGQKKLINQILVIYLSLTIPVCLILLFFQSHILHWFFATTISPMLFTITLMTTFLSFFSELFYQVLKYQQRAWTITLIQSSIACASIMLTIVLLMYVGLGVFSTVIGQLVSISAATGVGAYLYRQENFSAYFQFKQPKGTTRYFLKQGLPFVPGILCGWIISSSDRFVLAHYASLHEVGIYAIADMAGQMFRLLILQSWSGSYLPYILMRYHANKNNLLAIERQNLKTMWMVLGGLSIFLLSTFMFTKPLLFILIAPAYHEALDYVLIILAGHIFLLGSYFTASFIQFHKKTYFLAVSFCIPAVLNFLLNLLLVKQYKIYGATIATLMAYAIYFCMLLWYNRKLSRPYHEPHAQ